MLELFFILLFVAIFGYKATHYAKDDFVDLPTNSRSGTQKIGLANDASQSIVNSSKTAKNLINKILKIVRSLLWWLLLLGIIYLLFDFGIRMYKGVSDFMSDSVAISSVPVSTSTIRIIDGDFVPDKTDGTYLFTIEHNKSYRIKVSGCNLTLEADGVELNNNVPYKGKNCSNGSQVGYNKRYHFTKGFSEGALSPNDYYAMAILVIKKDGEKITKKIPIGDNLYTLNGKDFPGGKVYLYINLSIHSTVYDGEWHVVVDEI